MPVTVLRDRVIGANRCTGVGIGLAATEIIVVLTFVARYELPYRCMLTLTGGMLGFVLVVMVDESVQEIQFALFPSAESIVAHSVAAALLIGPYVIAKDVRMSRPQPQGGCPAPRPEQASSIAR